MAKIKSPVSNPTWKRLELSTVPYSRPDRKGLLKIKATPFNIAVDNSSGILI
jgi:hypothetical protein